MKSQPVIAIVGATGLVGAEMLSVLEASQLKVSEVRLLASENSEGEIYGFRGDELIVSTLSKDSFNEVDIALFATSAELSREFVPHALKAGAFVIDNSSAFRMDPEVPLVVPEVNPNTVTKNTKLIANPNCSTAQLVVALKPLHDLAKLKRVVVSTYQSVSGAGKAALDELWSQTLSIFQQKEMPQEIFAYQIAFNVFPHIDAFHETGYTKEERKVIDETRKILGIPELRITCTAVRVPVFHSHSESVNVEFERAVTRDDLIQALKNQDGLQVYEDDENFPMPTDVTGTDPVHVGRIRIDSSLDSGCDLWIVADNLRKGAALNAVQIAELVVAKFAGH